MIMSVWSAILTMSLLYTELQYVVMLVGLVVYSKLNNIGRCSDSKIVSASFHVCLMFNICVCIHYS